MYNGRVIMDGHKDVNNAFNSTLPTPGAWDWVPYPILPIKNHFCIY